MPLAKLGTPYPHRIWWRRGESYCLGYLKTRNLLILRNAKYAKNAQNAGLRYKTGTRNRKGFEEVNRSLSTGHPQCDSAGK